MDSLFNAICVLVTAALVLTFVPGLMLRERFPLSMGDRGRALLVRGAWVGRRNERLHRDWINERIVAVCAAGLLAGHLVGWS